MATRRLLAVLAHPDDESLGIGGTLAKYAAEGVEVSLTGERATEHPMVYTEVKVVYTVRGRKLNRALVERAVSLSDEKYCSATAMFKKTAKVTHELVLVEV